MKIVIAPDSFKEAISAIEVCVAIEHGFRIHFPSAEIISVPMADGGEGSLTCILNNRPGKLLTTTVQDPLGNPHEAQFGLLEDDPANPIAIIEMAEASGINLIPEQDRNPIVSSSYGTGELILAALNAGCKQFIVTLGGSGTCDGGIGAACALGIQFKNAQGEMLPANATAMDQIHSIDSSGLDPRLKQCQFTLAYDVNNKLLGLEGALMYAPQKGANASQIEKLHKGYEQLAHVLWQSTGKNAAEQVGSGAAGGLGAMLYAILNAKFVSGAKVIMNSINLLDKMQSADLVITAEGQIDAQTIHGKVPISVARLAKTMNLPVIAIAANLKEGFETIYHEGIDAVFSIAMGPISKQESIALSKPLLINIASNIARLIRCQV